MLKGFENAGRRKKVIKVFQWRLFKYFPKKNTFKSFEKNLFWVSSRRKQILELFLKPLKGVFLVCFLHVFSWICQIKTWKVLKLSSRFYLKFVFLTFQEVFSPKTHISFLGFLNKSFSMLDYKSLREAFCELFELSPGFRNNRIFLQKNQFKPPSSLFSLAQHFPSPSKNILSSFSYH